MHPLVAYLRDHSQPLEPIPTGIAPRLPNLEGIRCVAFDVYGTLLISASGDIGVPDTEQRDDTLRGILDDLGIPAPPVTGSLARHFVDLIKAEHGRRMDGGVDYPEVEIREIWTNLLAGHPEGPLPATEQIESLAVAYENATNPVWPMPGARALLRALREQELLLGIVSNAQFYTPLLFEALIGDHPDQLGFDPDLCFYSYQHRRGKPGTWLYEQLRDALAARSISPEETLYVGNDALKDIDPAAGLGFRTALFAGDGRSLRLREEHPELLPPEAIITDLAQVLELLAG